MNWSSMLKQGNMSSPKSKRADQIVRLRLQWEIAGTATCLSLKRELSQRAPD